jgi:hypothetical protein
MESKQRAKHCTHSLALIELYTIMHMFICPARKVHSCSHPILEGARKIKYWKGSPNTGRGHPILEGVTRYWKGSPNTGRGHPILEGVTRYWKGSPNTGRGHPILAGVPVLQVWPK